MQGDPKKTWAEQMLWTILAFFFLWLLPLLLLRQWELVSWVLVPMFTQTLFSVVALVEEGGNSLEEGG